MGSLLVLLAPITGASTNSGCLWSGPKKMEVKSYVLVICLSMVLARIDIERVSCEKRCRDPYYSCEDQCYAGWCVEDGCESKHTSCIAECKSKQTSCVADCKKSTQCYWDGEKTFLEPDGRFPKDNCTNCACTKQKVRCVTKPCELYCDDKAEGFSPVCKEESQAEQERCIQEDCTQVFKELKCLNAIIKLGECCPSCPDKAKCLWKKDDRMYEEGEKFKEDDCTECTCSNEKIECKTETCKEPAQLSCSNPITRAGECCPACEDEAKSEISCQTEQCKKPNCLNPITKAGECCPTCPDQDANSTEKPQEIKDANANNNTQLASTATKGHEVASSFLLMTWAHSLARQLSWLY